MSKNADGTMYSREQSIVIPYDKAKAGKVNLHIFAIAVTKYNDRTKNLRFPVKDAKKFISTLKRSSKQLFAEIIVHPLYDKEANRDKIIELFSNTKTDEKNMVIFYFSGHGKASGSGYYFLPHDYNDNKSVGQTALGSQVFLPLLKLVKGNKKIIILDTCYAGDFIKIAFKSEGSQKAMLKKIHKNSGLWVISATKQGKIAGEVEAAGGGLLTSVLCKAFANGDVFPKDNYITLSELSMYIRTELPKLAEKFRSEQEATIINTEHDYPIGRKIKVVDNVLNKSKLMTPPKELELTRKWLLKKGQTYSIAQMDTLESLMLSNVTDRGLKHLKTLKSLKTLAFMNSPITDKGLIYLKSLSNLEQLNLTMTKVTDRGLKHLKNLKNLKQLFLFGTKVTKKRVLDLKKALPNCQIHK